MIINLVTWNIFRNNNYFIDIISTLKEKRPDIICLQEVSDKHLNDLKTHFPVENYHILTSEQVFFSKKKSNIRLYNTTIVKRGLEIYKYHPQENKYNAPMNLLNDLRFEKVELNNLITYVVINSKIVPIVNCHLPCVIQPTERVSIIKKIISSLAEYENIIVCGDFNSFSNIFNSWFIGLAMGYKFKDYLFNETKELHDIFIDYQYEKIEIKFSTFKKVPTTLDYIYCRFVKQKGEVEKLYSKSSDHNGILFKFII